MYIYKVKGIIFTFFENHVTNISYTYPLYIALASMYLCMFETYLLRNGWIDLNDFFAIVLSWSGEGFIVEGKSKGKIIWD